MLPNQTPWDQFAETGKVNDYLEYCRYRDYMNRMYSASGAAVGGARIPDATDHQGNRPAGLQNTRG